MSIPLMADVFAETRFVLDTRALAGVRRFVARTLPDLAESPLADITMAVDEAVANVIKHAEPPPGSTLGLRIYLQSDHVRVILTNQGVPFDGDSLQPVDLAGHLAERRTGGLGVHLMKQLMDVVRFRTTRDGQQELVMVKILGAA